MRFWYTKMCHIYQKHFRGIWWFHSSKDFEAMKAGELAIWPWLSCQYTGNTLMGEPWYSRIQNKLLCSIEAPVIWWVLSKYRPKFFGSIFIVSDVSKAAQPKLKNVQENNLVHMFLNMTNATLLSEKEAKEMYPSKKYFFFFLFTNSGKVLITQAEISVSKTPQP